MLTLTCQGNLDENRLDILSMFCLHSGAETYR